MNTLQRYTDRRVLTAGGGSGIGLAHPDEGGTVAAADISESGLADNRTKVGDPHDRLTPS